ncbi:MAG: phospholipase D family protein [Puniceicoccales bacterium]|jgi:phosphatidylserine/phosphatidylglycerophosphate/cardiolipin synthase-like enzyme|nr:phospholipase D family protein [Puniceicoccales bacterium]
MKTITYSLLAGILALCVLCAADTPAAPAAPAAAAAASATRKPKTEAMPAAQSATQSSAQVVAVSRSAAAVAGAKPEVIAVGFSPGNAENVVIGTIRGARREIRMAAYTFSSTNIIRALEDARRRGVRVYVVLDSKGSNRTALRRLGAAGIPFRTCVSYQIMHNKFIVADGATVQTGSFNYTRAAATTNAENVIVLRDPALAALYTKEWQRLWDESRQQ